MPLWISRSVHTSGEQHPPSVESGRLSFASAMQVKEKVRRIQELEATSQQPSASPADVGPLSFAD